MKPKTIYLVLCLVGFALPYAEFVPWVMDHGFNPGLFVQHLFINRISAFFALDVVVSAIVLLRFAAVESARLRIPNRWIVVLATFLVGVSLGLPLFLYLREQRLQQIPAVA